MPLLHETVCSGVRLRVSDRRLETMLLVTDAASITRLSGVFNELEETSTTNTPVRLDQAVVDRLQTDQGLIRNGPDQLHTSVYIIRYVHGAICTRVSSNDRWVFQTHGAPRGGKFDGLSNGHGWSSTETLAVSEDERI